MQLSQLLDALQQRRQAPTDKWQPAYCGEIPLTIAADGQWYYQDSLIQRPELVRLFASVLVCEGSDYFLVTPHEKVKIKVVDAPFIVTQWQLQESNPAIIVAQTSLGDQFPLSKRYPLRLQGDIPYLDLGQNLTAKIHRNVFYQWLDLSVTQGQQVMLESAGECFVLGTLSE